MDANIFRDDNYDEIFRRLRADPISDAQFAELCAMLKEWEGSSESYEHFTIRFARCVIFWIEQKRRQSSKQDTQLPDMSLKRT